MNGKGCGRKQPWPNVRVLSQYMFRETEENQKNLSWDSWSLGQDLNPRPAK
jgi:hypothetical protein